MKTPEKGSTTALSRAAHSMSLKDVSKHYGSVKAVDYVSLTVTHGEFLTFLGPSGSGKSTILNLIAGFDVPTSGEVLMDEHPITNLPPEKRNFGMVFQGYALFPHMTVYDNISFPLRMRRWSIRKIEERVKETLELVRLTGFESRKPRSLSGGQQQRVAIARALAFWPDILLLDEPLGALDRKLRAEVQIELKQVHRLFGMTFIYVTHDQEEALSLSDRIAIIRDGRLIQVGTPSELYERPVNRFVADFLGKANFIHGEVLGRSDEGFDLSANNVRFRQALAKGEALPQGRVLIAIRPEKISIMDHPPTDERMNRVHGSIVNFSYFGSTINIAVNIPEFGNFGNIECIIQAWENRVEPMPGRNVWLVWSPDAPVVVAD